MSIARREYLRKSIHFSGLFFIPILLWNRHVFVALLASFLAVYLVVEVLDRKEIRIPFLTTLTGRCKRESEQGRLSRGAIFLVLSAIVTPYLFGSHAAAIALSQTFMADTVSTFAGRQWGRRKLPYSRGKSWVGSAAFLATAFVLSLFFVPWPQALVLAMIGALVESLPIPEADNLTIPLAVGLAARLLQ